MSPNDILDSIRPINPSAFGMTREQAMMMHQGGPPGQFSRGMPPQQGQGQQQQPPNQRPPPQQQQQGKRGPPPVNPWQHPGLGGEF